MGLCLLSLFAPSSSPHSFHLGFGLSDMSSLDGRSDGMEATQGEEIEASHYPWTGWRSGEREEGEEARLAAVHLTLPELRLDTRDWKEGWMPALREGGAFSGSTSLPHPITLILL